MNEPEHLADELVILCKRKGTGMSKAVLMCAPFVRYQKYTIHEPQNGGHTVVGMAHALKPVFAFCCDCMVGV